MLVARFGLTVVVVASVLANAACRPPAPTGSPSATGGPSASTAIDACLVGNWRELSYQQIMDLTGVGGARAVVQGVGRTLTFRADGTELVDYGTGVTLRGTGSDGVVVEALFTGTVEYRVSTVEGQLAFELVADNVRIEYRSGGRVVLTSTFGTSPPVSYTCNSETMTQSADDYQAEYRRA